MKINETDIRHGENLYQNARLEIREKIIDYDVSAKISFNDAVSLNKSLSLISEFYDVKAACSVQGSSIYAVALGQSLADAVQKVMDINPVDFISSMIVVSSEVDSETAKLLRYTNIIVGPKFTKNAIEILESYNVRYVTIKTPLKDYKQYLPEDVKSTSMGTFIQSPNLSELNKDSFKVVTKQKPSVEQIEDAIFAWKVAKYLYSRSIVVAKDLKTVALVQCAQSSLVEFVLNYACENSKDAVLASDMPITEFDVDVASQGRIGLIIVPNASEDIVKKADKYSMSVITTEFTNILY